MDGDEGRRLEGGLGDISGGAIPSVVRRQEGREWKRWRREGFVSDQ